MVIYWRGMEKLRESEIRVGEERRDRHATDGAKF